MDLKLFSSQCNGNQTVVRSIFPAVEKVTRVAISGMKKNTVPLHETVHPSPITKYA